MADLKVNKISYISSSVVQNKVQWGGVISSN